VARAPSLLAVCEGGILLGTRKIPRPAGESAGLRNDVRYLVGGTI